MTWKGPESLIYYDTECSLDLSHGVTINSHDNFFVLHPWITVCLFFVKGQANIKGWQTKKIYAVQDFQPQIRQSHTQKKSKVINKKMCEWNLSDKCLLGWKRGWTPHLLSIPVRFVSNRTGWAIISFAISVPNDLPSVEIASFQQLNSFCWNIIMWLKKCVSSEKKTSNKKLKASKKYFLFWLAVSFILLYASLWSEWLSVVKINYWSLYKHLPKYQLVKTNSKVGFLFLPRLCVSPCNEG